MVILFMGPMPAISRLPSLLLTWMQVMAGLKMGVTDIILLMTILILLAVSKVRLFQRYIFSP